MRWMHRMQGGYYLLSGLWPLVHFRSFIRLAGPKPDRFQTQVTGALFAATGLALLAGEPEARGTRLLAGGTAAAALVMECAYRRYLPRAFLLDGVLQGVFLMAAAKPHAVPAEGGVPRALVAPRSVVTRAQPGAR